MTLLSMRKLDSKPSDRPADPDALPAHDVPAFREVVVEHAPALLRMLRGLGVRGADLDDVFQETLIVVHRRLPSFEGRSSLRTWLYGIALRVASAYRDKAYRRREIPAHTLPDLDCPETQESALHSKEAWALLEHLLAPLSEDRRQIFVLYEIAQMSVPEIATLLDWPLQTAYSRLHAAREHVERGVAALHRKGLAR